ncbi:hrr1, partial [Symbiodinium sp. CCMP2456]
HGRDRALRGTAEPVGEAPLRTGSAASGDPGCYGGCPPGRRARGRRFLRDAQQRHRSHRLPERPSTSKCPFDPRPPCPLRRG